MVALFLPRPKKAIPARGRIRALHKAYVRLIRRSGIGAMLVMSLLSTSPLGAQEMALPVETQWSLFDRILAFDRNFPERSGDALVVGILHQRRHRPSLNAMNEVLAAAENVTTRLLGAEDIRLVPMEFTTLNEMDRFLEREGIDVLYLAPLRSTDLTAISEHATQARVITLTGIREYVELGVAVGLGIRGGRPEIVINLPVCRDQGMDLSSELLKLATVLDAAPPSNRTPNASGSNPPGPDEDRQTPGWQSHGEPRRDE